jgi:hypothetical protein
MQERALAAKERELGAAACDPAVPAAEVERLRADVEKWRGRVRGNRAAIAALQETTDKLVAVWGHRLDYRLKFHGPVAN